MLVGEERNKVDKIWDTFWTGGLTNPLLVIEQFTYLLFIKQLDDIETTNEANAEIMGYEYTEHIFSSEQQNYRWHIFKNMTDTTKQLELIRDEIFPFIKNLHPDGEASYSRFMKDASFIISAPDKLSKIISGIDTLNLDDEDSKGDLYEYMLSKLSVSKVNGQFRTPRHIIKMMVDLVEPNPNDIIADPAMGTAGFLVAAVEYLRQHHEQMFFQDDFARRFDSDMFHGFDTDPTMLRIGAMNMLLHGVKNASISYKDSLAKVVIRLDNKDDDNKPEQTIVEKDKYTLVLANPPFKGSLDYGSVEDSLLRVTKTKKTELLFLALFLRLLKLGGRAAVIVPDGVLFGSSTAHKAIRKKLVDDNKLTAVISMPSGVFKPYAGVSTAVLIFTKTLAGGTDQVWFYDMKADGRSLDDKRQPIDNNDIPDIVARFHNLEQEKIRKRTEQSFFVPVEEIRQNGYDLSINKYKETEYQAVEYPSTQELMAKLANIDGNIQNDMEKLREMLA